MAPSMQRPRAVDARARKVADENSAAYAQKQASQGSITAASGVINGARRALQTVTNTAAGRIFAEPTSGIDSKLRRPVVRPSHGAAHDAAVAAAQPQTHVPEPVYSDDTIDDEEHATEDISMEYEDSVLMHSAAHELKEGDAAADFSGSEFFDQSAIANSIDGADSDSEVGLFDPVDMYQAAAARRFAASRSVSNPSAIFPVDNATFRAERREAADEVAATPGLLDEQDEDWFDIGMVCEYSTEILAHMRKMELALLPDHGYMDNQTELNWQLRRVLNDWIVQVHNRYNLLPETLYLTMNYIDRFMSVKDVALSKFQLVGAVALFLAAKFEEINYLSVQELLSIVEGQYPLDEILKAERYMVDMLDFNMAFPGPMSFLRRASKADDYDLDGRTLAKYLLEVTLMDERFISAPPSWTAAISLYLARVMLNQDEWTKRHVFFAGYTEAQLLPGVEVLRECLQDASQHHRAVYEKYSERRFRKVSLFVQDWISH